MKYIYTLCVNECVVTKLESILNKIYIGLDDWDRTKGFGEPGSMIYVYAVVCTQNEYEAINNLMNNN